MRNFKVIPAAMFEQAEEQKQLLARIGRIKSEIEQLYLNISTDILENHEVSSSVKTSRDSLNNINISFKKQIDVLETVAEIYTKAEKKALNNYNQVVERANTRGIAPQEPRLTRRATFNPNLVVEGWLSQLVYEDMLKENTESDEK